MCFVVWLVWGFFNLKKNLGFTAISEQHHGPQLKEQFSNFVVELAKSATNQLTAYRPQKSPNYFLMFWEKSLRNTMLSAVLNLLHKDSTSSVGHL